MANEEPISSNAAPAQLSEEQRSIMEVITSMIKADNDTAGVVVLKLKKDGTVTRLGGSVVLNPPDLIARILHELAEVMQARFMEAVSAGELCNCPACIAKRGGAFMNPTVKAEA